MSKVLKPAKQSRKSTLFERHKIRFEIERDFIEKEINMLKERLEHINRCLKQKSVRPIVCPATLESDPEYDEATALALLDQNDEDVDEHRVEHCDACRNTGYSYWSDDCWGDCLECHRTQKTANKNEFF